MVPLWQVRWRRAGDLRMAIPGARVVAAHSSTGGGAAIAQKHWSSFVTDCRDLSRHEYRKAIEELESLAECHRMALDEEEEDV